MLDINTEFGTEASVWLRILPIMLVFSVIYVIVLITGHLLWKEYENLVWHEKCNFASVVAAVGFSIYVGYNSVVAIYTTNVWVAHDTSLTSYDDLTMHIVEVFLGYMVFDSVLLLYNNVKNQSFNQFMQYLFHHMAAVLAYHIMVKSGQGMPMGMMGAVTEITSPMLHFKWILEKSGYKNSGPYVVNGTLFMLGFLFFRVVLGSWVSYTFVFGQDAQLATLGAYKYYMFYLTYGVALLLQYFWFYKILKGYYKGVSAFLKGPSVDKKTL